MGFFNSEAQNRTKAQGTWPPSRHNTLNKLHSAGGRDNHKQKKKKKLGIHTEETTHLGYVEASKTAYTEQRKLSVRTYTSGSGCLHSFVQWNAEEIAGLGKKINALRRSQELLPWLCSGKGNILAECLNKVVAMEKKTCFALVCTGMQLVPSIPCGYYSNRYNKISCCQHTANIKKALSCQDCQKNAPYCRWKGLL